MVEQSPQIFDEICWTSAIRPIPRRAESTMIEGYAAIAPRQLRDLLPPTQMAATAAVSQNKIRPFTVHLIIEIDSIHLS